MSKQTDHQSQLVNRFETLIKMKDLQLEGLKKIAVTLAEIEDENAFIHSVLPIIKKVMNIKNDLSIFVKMDDDVLSVSKMKEPILSETHQYLLKNYKFRKNVVVVSDPPTSADSPPTCSFINQKDDACAFSPIFHEQADIGFLAFPFPRKRKLNKDEKTFLKYIGETLGVFFSSTKLNKELSIAKEQLEKNFNELFTVYAVSSAVSGSMGTKSVLESALNSLFDQATLNIEKKGLIFLYNETTDRLELSHYKGIQESIVEQEKNIPLGHCLCGLAAQNREIIISTNCFTDKRHHANYPEMSAHGHIILPLEAEGKFLGVMCLYLPPETTPSQNQISMLTSISNQISIALVNAQLYEEIKHLSLHDSLTGLANRKLLHNRLEDEVSRSNRYGDPLSVAMVDLDNFKLFNDEFGHVAGDELLKQLASIMREQVRHCDLVARYGGEEFTIIMPQTNLDQAIIPLERLRERVSNHPFIINKDPGNPKHTTISIGVCNTACHESFLPNFLLEEADKALYKAKNAGKNRVMACQDPMDAA
ncbi:MAG: sensor domain-containing diguanylate cyclase [Proteobacteria bacterium]|nr:sensor domain-containing diguanylate cyclase [Pseudomonadota bacterium]MBU1709197.1 sensor domain-containing diguanylate cyclase [Pseudomonadota bacterium]